jgi:hypothetical protein
MTTLPANQTAILSVSANQGSPDLPPPSASSPIGCASCCCSNGRPTLQQPPLLSAWSPFTALSGKPSNASLLATLLQAACALDFAASRREVGTQTAAVTVSFFLSSEPPEEAEKEATAAAVEDDGGRGRKRKRRHDREESKKRGRRRRHRRRSSHRRHGKSGKRKKRKRSCASPSYSDYEPENPLLRLRLKQQQQQQQQQR